MNQDEPMDVDLALNLYNSIHAAQRHFGALPTHSWSPNNYYLLNNSTQCAWNLRLCTAYIIVVSNIY